MLSSDIEDLLSKIKNKETLVDSKSKKTNNLTLAYKAKEVKKWLKDSEIEIVRDTTNQTASDIDFFNLVLSLKKRDELLSPVGSAVFSDALSQFYSYCLNNAASEERAESFFHTHVIKEIDLLRQVDGLNQDDFEFIEASFIDFKIQKCINSGSIESSYDIGDVVGVISGVTGEKIEKVIRTIREELDIDVKQKSTNFMGIKINGQSITNIVTSIGKADTSKKVILYLEKRKKVNKDKDVIEPGKHVSKLLESRNNAQEKDVKR